MTLYETIYVRRSVRSFKMDIVPEELLKNVEKFKNEIDPFYPEISTKMEIIRYTDFKEQFKGSMVVKAPYYLAIYSEEKEGYMINAGYLMEQVALYLSMRGFGTCYQGNATKKDNSNTPPHKFIMILAFGYAKGKSYREKNTATRLKLSELCTFKDDIGKQTKTVLEAARLAPSSMNTQPWRFVVYENRIHIFLKRPSLGLPVLTRWNEFDMGIMLSHIMLTAEELWVDISMKKLDNITHKTIPNNQYITSVIFK